VTDLRQRISDAVRDILLDEGVLEPGKLITDWVLLAAVTGFEDERQYGCVHHVWQRHDQPLHVEIGLLHSRLMEVAAIHSAVKTRSVLDDDDD